MVKTAKKTPSPPKNAAPVLGAEDIISALYRALLLRDPDEPGLKNQTAKFVSEGFDIEKAVSSILSSREFSGKAWNVLSKYVGYDRMRFTNDKSQHGEALAFIRHLVVSGSKHQIVVDVGARGVDRSNSFDLMKHFGWKGLLVDNSNYRPGWC